MECPGTTEIELSALRTKESCIMKLTGVFTPQKLVNATKVFCEPFPHTPNNTHSARFMTESLFSYEARDFLRSGSEVLFISVPWYLR